MLLSLSIKNYVLIDSLELSPAEGMSAITGETGAGKSILLGALNLLLGQRNMGGSTLLFDSSRKCVIEASFDISSYGLEGFLEAEGVDVARHSILRRELLPDAKSRAFINDTPVSLELMARFGGQLIDIHSQHETTHLVRGDFQRWVIDGWSGHEALRSAYQQAHGQAKATRAAYELVHAQRKESAEAYVRYQLEELQATNLVLGEEKELEARLKHMDAHKERAEARAEALALLEGNDTSYGVLRSLSLLGEALGKLSSSPAAAGDPSGRVEVARLDLKDLADTIQGSHNEAEASAEERITAQERLDVVYGLLRKHKKQDSAELLDLEKQLEEAVVAEEGQANEEERLARACREAEEKVDAAAKALSAARHAACAPFSEAVSALLTQLGMPAARFYVEQEAVQPQWDGADRLIFFFSANQGILPRPLAQVASGGERSRLMLAIKYLLAQKKRLPTLLFDEIDTGVSGEMAKVLVRLVEEMSKRHQVMVITHLPRFAARADTHVLIYKEEQGGRTLSKARVLDSEERVRALAEMLDGINPSLESLNTARRMRQDALS